MCSLIKTCTVGAPAATQPPEKKSVNKNSMRWRPYKNIKIAQTQIDCKHSQADTGTINRNKYGHTQKKQASKQQQEIPRFVMKEGLTGC